MFYDNLEYNYRKIIYMISIKIVEKKKYYGCTALSFASEERLAKHLQLTKGAVTPLGVINDADCDQY